MDELGKRESASQVVTSARARWAGKSYEDISDIVSESLNKLMGLERFSPAAGMAVAFLCKVQMVVIEELRMKAERDSFRRGVRLGGMDNVARVG